MGRPSTSATSRSRSGSQRSRLEYPDSMPSAVSDAVLPLALRPRRDDPREVRVVGRAPERPEGDAWNVRNLWHVACISSSNSCLLVLPAPRLGSTTATFGIPGARPFGGYQRERLSAAAHGVERRAAARARPPARACAPAGGADRESGAPGARPGPRTRARADAHGSAVEVPRSAAWPFLLSGLGRLATRLVQSLASDGSITSPPFLGRWTCGRFPHERRLSCPRTSE